MILVVDVYTIYIVTQGVILAPAFCVSRGTRFIESDTSLSFADGAVVGYRLT